MKILAALALSITAHLLAAQQVSTLTNERFTVTYPNDWQLDESGMMGSSFVLFSPQVNDDDFFRENVNLIEQDLSGYNFDLNQYIDLTLSQLTQMITNYELKSSKRVSSSPEYHKLVYNGTQGQFNLTFTQHIWIVGTKAFVLTFTTEQSQFVKYQKTGESILNSFKIN